MSDTKLSKIELHLLALRIAKMLPRNAEDAERTLDLAHQYFRLPRMRRIARQKRKARGAR
jgi:hypothetical protein